jgi:DNA-binding NarL/FixJ family response regulator
MFAPEKIIIADDHPLFRQALFDMLQTQFSSTTWLATESIQQLMLLLQQHDDIDMLLLDLDMPDAHGFNALVQIRQQFPQIPVVIVSAFEGGDTIAKALSLGAAGFIPKSTPVPQIVAAINQIFSGQQWTPTSFDPKHHPLQSIEISQRVASLTPQQYKILTMFADGLLNKQIAYELGVSEATIKAHATAIFKKLDVRNRTQAVIAISALELAEQPTFN